MPFSNYFSKVNQSKHRKEKQHVLQCHPNLERLSLKRKLGKIFLLAQSFYLTLTKGRLRPPRSYLVNFGPFNLVFDQLWGFSVKIAY